MKNKQSKTNTHLSRTSLLSDNGPVPLPEDLSIPTVQKDDRQERRLLPEPQRTREEEEEEGAQPAGAWPASVIETSGSSRGARCELPSRARTSLAQFAKTFLILPKAQEGPEKQSDGLAAVRTPGQGSPGHCTETSRGRAAVPFSSCAPGHQQGSRGLALR